MTNVHKNEGFRLEPIGYKFLDIFQVKDFLENFDILCDGKTLEYGNFAFNGSKILYIDSKLMNIERVVL